MPNFRRFACPTTGLILALLVTAALYLPGFSGGWLFDDYPNIVDNPGVQPADASLSALAITQWQQTLAPDKNLAHYAPQLAGYLLQQHRPQEARAVIAKAIALQPTLAHDATLQALQDKARQQR